MISHEFSLCLQGNVQRDAYILTQAPMSNTTEDFWRMVSQYDVSTVVMLNDLREGKEVNEGFFLWVRICYPFVVVSLLLSFFFTRGYRPNALSAQALSIWREREAYCDKT